MKKVLVLVLSIVMVLAFASCGGDDSADNGDSVKVGCIFLGSVNDGGFSQCMNIKGICHNNSSKSLL